MPSARRRVMMTGAVLLLFAVAILLLVRLAMAMSSNTLATPVTSFAPATEGNRTPTADGSGAGGPRESAPRVDRVPLPAGSGEEAGVGAPGPARGGGMVAPGEAARRSESADAGASARADRPDRAPTSTRRPEPHHPPVVLISASTEIHAKVPQGTNGYPLLLEGGQVADIEVFEDFRFAIPAQLTGIALRLDHPTAAMTLATPVPQENTAPQENTVPCRPGRIAEPMRGERPYLCTVGIRMAESAEPNRSYSGTVYMTFEATCTSKVGKPCESLPERYNPSSADPVRVRFICFFGLTFSKKE